jgi:hypothetical protein
MAPRADHGASSLTRSHLAILVVIRSTSTIAVLLITTAIVSVAVVLVVNYGVLKRIALRLRRNGESE